MDREINGKTGMPYRLGKVLILSGPIGSGKTTLCLDLVEHLKKADLVVHGIVTPPVNVNGNKVGIDLVDLQSEEKKRFASLNESVPTGLSTGKWSFDADVMNWGDQTLGHATPCQVLIVDELGPLEFERGIGFQNGVAAIDSGDFSVALVVIRPSLIMAAKQRWSTAKLYSVTRETQPAVLNDLIEQIVEYCVD